MRTKVINLFAGPGSGKSTAAAGLFFEMKHAGCKVELVTEYAKELCYEMKLCSTSPIHILEEQANRLDRLGGQVEYIITDSPLLLGLVYAEPGEVDYQSVIREYERWDNIQFFVKRVKPYETYGRVQSEVQANGLDGAIRDMLQKHSPYYYIIKGNKSAPKNIVATLKRFEGLIGAQKRLEK